MGIACERILRIRFCNWAVPFGFMAIDSHQYIPVLRDDTAAPTHERRTRSSCYQLKIVALPDSCFPCLIGYPVRILSSVKYIDKPGRHHKNAQMYPSVVGAQGRTRTGTSFRTADFKSFYVTNPRKHEQPETIKTISCLFRFVWVYPVSFQQCDKSVTSFRQRIFNPLLAIQRSVAGAGFSTLPLVFNLAIPAQAP